MDGVAAQGRVTAGPDLYARVSVGGDVVVFQRPQSLVIHEDASCLAVVDGVAAQARVSSVVDTDAREALAGDVAAFQLQPTLRDVHGVPLALAASLAQGQVRDPADVGLEQHRIGAAGLDFDVGDRAVSEDLQRLVDHQALLVQPRPHQDAIPRPRRRDGLADRAEIPPLIGVHYVGRRLGSSCHPGRGRRFGRLGLRHRLPHRLTGATRSSNGRAPERIAHPGGKLRHGLAHHGRGERLEAQIPPVRELPRRQHPRHLVGVAPLGIIQLRGAHVVHRQDQILTAQVALPRQEPLDFRTAGGAAEKTGGDDDQQQCHRVQCLVKPLLPVLPPGDVMAILKDQKLLAGLHPDLGAESLTELAELTVVVLIIETDVAHERGWVAWHDSPPPTHPPSHANT